MRETALWVHSYFDRSPADTVAPSICLARSVVPRRSLAQGGRRRHPRRNLSTDKLPAMRYRRSRKQFSPRSSAADHPTIDRRNVSGTVVRDRDRPVGIFPKVGTVFFKNVRRVVCFAVSTMLRASRCSHRPRSGGSSSDSLCQRLHDGLQPTAASVIPDPLLDRQGAAHEREKRYEQQRREGARPAPEFHDRVRQRGG
jgi:hypothetical protein